jgi:hypothetical protein
MRPAGPLPATCRRSIPASRARSRTAGDASGFSPSGRGAPGGVREASPRRIYLRLGRAERRRLRVGLGARGRGFLAVHPQSNQRRTHGDGVADVGAEPDDFAMRRRGYFDRRLVGHHGAEDFVLANEVADLDPPLDQFRLCDTLADVGQLDHALAHRHASRVASNARPILAGPGK